MTFGDNEFMDYMGYRNMIVEEKIEKYLAAFRRGETTIGIDRDDLNEDEMRYLQKEVMRRLRQID